VLLVAISIFSPQILKQGNTTSCGFCNFGVKLPYFTSDIVLSHDDVILLWWIPAEKAIGLWGSAFTTCELHHRSCNPSYMRNHHNPKRVFFNFLVMALVYHIVLWYSVKHIWLGLLFRNTHFVLWIMIGKEPR